MFNFLRQCRQCPSWIVVAAKISWVVARIWVGKVMKAVFGHLGSGQLGFKLVLESTAICTL
jgi:hypothetical protein